MLTMCVAVSFVIVAWQSYSNSENPVPMVVLLPGTIRGPTWHRANGWPAKLVEICNNYIWQNPSHHLVSRGSLCITVHNVLHIIQQQYSGTCPLILLTVLYMYTYVRDESCIYLPLATVHPSALVWCPPHHNILLYIYIKDKTHLKY
jgi:hypothetical protein